MKKTLSAYLQNELVGQAILDMIIQNIPISERALCEQLLTMQSHHTEPLKKEILQKLIVQMSAKLGEVNFAEKDKVKMCSLSHGDEPVTAADKNKTLH